MVPRSHGKERPIHMLFPSPWKPFSSPRCLLSRENSACFSGVQLSDHFHGAPCSLHVFSGLMCNILTPHIKDSILTILTLTMAFPSGPGRVACVHWTQPWAEGGRPPPPPNHPDHKGQELPESGDPPFSRLIITRTAVFPPQSPPRAAPLMTGTGERRPLWPGRSKANLWKKRVLGARRSADTPGRDFCC